MPGGDQAAIGDEQRTREAERGSELAETPKRTATEDHVGPEPEIEGLHRSSLSSFLSSI
jgi:hypothetical protein